MKIPRFSLLFATLVLSAGIALADEARNHLSAEEKAAGWRLLFDGKSLAGWTNLGKNEVAPGWVAQDGLLKRVEKAGDVVTTEHFTDFELTWQWSITAKGNSGVKYNLPDPKKAVGFEYQLIDDTSHPDASRGGRLHQTAGLYDLIEPPADRKLNPPGEWNSSRIVVQGAHVEHWLNGVKTAEFEMGSEDLKARIAKSKYARTPKFGEKTASPILLQDHGDNVSFHSIKLRPLPAK